MLYPLSFSFLLLNLCLCSDSSHHSSPFHAMFPQFSFSLTCPSIFRILSCSYLLQARRIVSASPHHLQSRVMAIIIPNNSSLFLQTCTTVAWTSSPIFQTFIGLVGKSMDHDFCSCPRYFFSELMTLIKRQTGYWHFMVLPEERKSTYSFTPGETCGVMLFDVSLKLRPDVQIRLHPINMACVTVKTEAMFMCGCT